MQQKLRCMTHPSYSSDLAPFDFSVYPMTKAELHVMSFQNLEGAIAQYIRGMETRH